jgi:hypothetical protein
MIRDIITLIVMIPSLSYAIIHYTDQPQVTEYALNMNNGDCVEVVTLVVAIALIWTIPVTNPYHRHIRSNHMTERELKYHIILNHSKHKK